MTPAFRSFFCWVILLLTGSNLIIAQSSSGRPLSKAIWITDKVISELPDTLTILQPLYDNQYQTRRVLPIRYLVKSVGKRAWLKNWSKGTFLCSWQSIKEDTLSSVNILDRPGVFQLIKRDSDDYVGYLEELLTVPFVMPPRLLYSGHQTDLRLGVDCAELAIYGKRRQGYDIPYCGPQKIVNYLKETDSIRRGTVVSFGFQISVVYEDRGLSGQLDDADLLIHAYKDKAEIISFGESGLNRYPYKLYEWKE